VRLLAISVDPQETNHAHRLQQGYEFTFLSDTNAEVIRRYDLLHEAAGPGRVDISRPAEFLIDSKGTVRWENITPSFAVRARPEQVLKIFDDLGLSAAGRGPGG